MDLDARERFFAAGDAVRAYSERCEADLEMWDAGELLRLFRVLFVACVEYLGDEQEAQQLFHDAAHKIRLMVN